MLPYRPVFILRVVFGAVVSLGCLVAAAQEFPAFAIGVPNVLAQPAPAAPDAESPAEVPARSAEDPIERPTGTLDLARDVELVTERYPEGNVRIEREVTQDAEGNYINHGSFTQYDPHGMVVRSGEFRNGRQHGNWLRYFQTGEGSLFSGSLDKQFPGPFVSEATFLDGRLHGTWTITSRSRRKIIEWHFENGARHGKSTWWYPGGQKRREIIYDHGNADGEFLEWSRDGTLATRATLVGGRLLTKRVKWYAPGQKFYEGYYLSGENLAEPVFDWWNGVAGAVPFENEGPELKHDTWTAYYRNGQKKVEGRYREDLPVGKFSWWYENGQKQAEGEYVDGLESGTWTTWHLNGLKESVGEYTAGMLTGNWMRWEPGGKVIEIRDFNPKRLPETNDRANSDEERGDDDSEPEIPKAGEPVRQARWNTTT